MHLIPVVSNSQPHSRSLARVYMYVLIYLIRTNGMVYAYSVEWPEEGAER